MKEELSRHKLAYIILFAGLLVFTLLFLGAWPNRIWQRLIVLAIVAFYCSWGFITHLHYNHLTKQVAWEYLGMALLAGALLLLVTL